MEFRAANSPAISRLHIGIAHDARNMPAWVRELIDFFVEVPHFDVSLCPQPNEGSPPGHRESWFARQLLEPSRRLFDPFAPGPTPAVPPMPSAPMIRERELDLLLWLAPGPPAASTARYGAISLEFGDRDIDPPYWGEVIAGDPVSRVTIRWQEHASTIARVIRAAEIPTLRSFPYTRNAEGCLLAAIEVLAEVALDIAQQGPEWVARARTMPPAPPLSDRRPPSNLESIVFACWEKYQARRKPDTVPQPMEWFCALRRDPSKFYTGSGRFERSGLEDIPKAAGAHMADPFLVADNGVDWLFFEDIPPGQKKGRISCVRIPEPGEDFPAPEVVLEGETHLSYPCVFRHEGEYFMIPESCVSADVRLYRATRFPLEWQLECLLIENFALTDTTPLFLDGHWYFFTTTMPPVQQTVLLTSTKLGSPLRLHGHGPVSCSWRNTRSAGHLFSSGGRLFRPAQDGVIRYGYGISINEVTRLNQSEYRERAAGYIGPDWRPGLLGTHTLTANQRLEVIDARRYAEGRA
jgi:hypothetical protein